MADENENTGKKVDEEWKRKAEEEKERAGKAAEQGHDYSGPPPDPSLAFLVSGIVSQALIGLGQVANPLTQKQELNLEEAKFAIDTLQMLQEKTKGNLTDEEKKYLDAVLNDLRMRFIDAAG